MSSSSDFTASPSQELDRYLHRTVYLIDRIADRALQAQAGLSLSQYMLLSSIAQNQHAVLSQQAIADHLGIDKAAVSRQVLRLEEKAWVQRQLRIDSRREHTLHLTADGEKALKAAQTVMKRTVSPHYAKAGSDLLNQFKVLCSSLEAVETNR